MNIILLALACIFLIALCRFFAINCANMMGCDGRTEGMNQVDIGARELKKEIDARISAEEHRKMQFKAMKELRFKYAGNVNCDKGDEMLVAVEMPQDYEGELKCNKCGDKITADLGFRYCAPCKFVLCYQCSWLRNDRNKAVSAHPDMIGGKNDVEMKDKSLDGSAPPTAREEA